MESDWLASSQAGLAREPNHSYATIGAAPSFNNFNKKSLIKSTVIQGHNHRWTVVGKE